MELLQCEVQTDTESGVHTASRKGGVLHKVVNQSPGQNQVHIRQKELVAFVREKMRCEQCGGRSLMPEFNTKGEEKYIFCTVCNWRSNANDKQCLSL